MQFVLASASPRRQELLRSLLTDFSVCAADVDEEGLTTPDPWETAKLLALHKAKCVSQLCPTSVVIGGDTVVAIQETGWTQLAKPRDEADAHRMLSLLSGRSHVVITGIALVGPKLELVDAATTEVTFRKLDPAEVADYVRTGEPMDKAGAYAIQGGAAAWVEQLEGSRSNVVGLPLELMTSMLDQARILASESPSSI